MARRSMSYEDDPEAQWAPDPSGRYDYRYWDGTQWTGHVKNGGLLPTAPPGLREPQRSDASDDQPSPGYRTTSATVVPSPEHDRYGYGGDEDDGDGYDDDQEEYGRGRGSRRSFWTGVLVGGAVVLVVAAAAFVLTDRSTGSPRPAAAVATTTLAPTTTLPPTTTTTVNPGRPPAQVRVRVINATGGGTLATQKMAQLTPLGYQNAGVADGTVRKGTAVQCRPGFELEAVTLAKNVADGAVVEPFPTTPPTGSTNADCLVVLGTA